jgi:putative transposase
MDNHFHCVVTTPHGNLDDLMEQLESRFARYSNWRYNRVGHLFQGTYPGIVIEHDIQLLIALCYVFLNPVSAGLVARPQDYKWSTYAASVGLAPALHYVSLDWLFSLFPEETLENAQRRFHDLMSSPDPLNTYLDDGNMTGVHPELIRQVVRSYTGEELRLGLLPSIYRSALRSSLAELFPDGMSREARADAIYNAHVEHGYTLSAIARQLHRCPSGVSRIYRRIREMRRNRGM